MITVKRTTDYIAEKPVQRGAAVGALVTAVALAVLAALVATGVIASVPHSSYIASGLTVGAVGVALIGGYFLAPQAKVF